MSDAASNKSSIETQQSYEFMDAYIFYEVLKSVNIILGTLTAAGLFINIVNIIVFYQQGLNTSTNIALTAVSIADVCTLFLTAIAMFSAFPMVEDLAQNVFAPREIAILFLFPRKIFVPVKSWINTFMTAERCLCIALPLKIKQIITPKRTVLAIVAIYILNVPSIFVEYSEVYLDWKFYPGLNKTLIGLLYRHDRNLVESPVYLVLFVMLITSFPITILFTSILIWKLLVMSKWRKTLVHKNAPNKNSNQASLRDRKVITLVVVVACFLMITLVPNLLFHTLTYTVAEFNVNGKYYQLFNLLGALDFLFDTFNSTCHIFIYYNMSSKFRQTFHKIFIEPLRQCKHVTS